MTDDRSRRAADHRERRARLDDEVSDHDARSGHPTVAAALVMTGVVVFLVVVSWYGVR